jgi:hypothetical protein
LAQGLVFVLAVVLVVFFIWHVRTLEGICMVLGPIYMVINMAFSYWRPWYALWPLTFAALLPYRKWAWLIAIYGWLVLCTYLIIHSSGICPLP